jgi:sulfatase modifying factor 1
MKNLLITSILIGIGSVFPSYGGEALSRSSVKIPGGTFKPLFGPGSEKDKPAQKVITFRIDIHPVSVGEFQKFLIKNSSWKKGALSSDYADGNYLNNFPTEKATPSKQPVTYVSWFAATAFCESKNGRLPSTVEWEYVGAASETVANALNDDAFADKILLWYSDKSQKAKDVDSGVANFYGVKNLHSMNWEWTSDFNSFFLSGDNRQDGDSTRGMFCGSGALGASNKKDYAAFMRYALRSSLKANYSQKNVGFRCAYDE